MTEGKRDVQNCMKAVLVSEFGKHILHLSNSTVHCSLALAAICRSAASKPRNVHAPASKWTEPRHKMLSAADSPAPLSSLQNTHRTLHSSQYNDAQLMTTMTTTNQSINPIFNMAKPTNSYFEGHKGEEQLQEAQLPQRNSASAAHMDGG